MTTAVCPLHMRWLGLFAIAACTTRPPVEAPIAARGAGIPTVREPTALRSDMEMPTLPPKLGFDRIEDAGCRAQYRHVVRILDGEVDVSYPQRVDEMRRLARLAVASNGDCRIDTDALLTQNAPNYAGGCRGPELGEALAAWGLIIAVASSRPRRLAALRNAASLAFRYAERRGDDLARWVIAGDAYARAAKASRDDLELWERSVDAYEHALAQPPRAKQLEREDVAHISKMLAEITDGGAGDRATSLRAKLHF